MAKICKQVQRRDACETDCDSNSDSNSDSNCSGSLSGIVVANAIT